MTLAQLLKQHEAQLDGLMSLLRREREILVQGDADPARLAPLAEAKQAAFARLRQLEQRRLSLQQGLEPEADDGAGERAARKAGCLERWRGILEAARTVAQSNRLNGTLIQQQLRHNQRVLATLRRLAGHSLYGADGQPSSKPARLQLQA